MFEVVNAIEAIVWALTALAIVVWARVARITPKQHKNFLDLCVFLVLFGATDLVEMRTAGVWWRPWGMLVANIACVVGMIWVITRIYHCGKA